MLVRLTSRCWSWKTRLRTESTTCAVRAAHSSLVLRERRKMGYACDRAEDALWRRLRLAL